MNDNMYIKLYRMPDGTVDCMVLFEKEEDTDNAFCMEISTEKFNEWNDILLAYTRMQMEMTDMWKRRRRDALIKKREQIEVEIESLNEDLKDLEDELYA